MEPTITNTPDKPDTMLFIEKDTVLQQKYGLAVMYTNSIEFLLRQVLINCYKATKLPPTLGGLIIELKKYKEDEVVKKLHRFNEDSRKLIAHGISGETMENGRVSFVLIKGDSKVTLNYEFLDKIVKESKELQIILIKKIQTLFRDKP